MVFFDLSWPNPGRKNCVEELTDSFPSVLKQMEEEDARDWPLLS